jgi:purine-binding chemotaxis protein CheW
MSAVCVRVTVGQEHYAVPVDHVLEVAESGDVAPVPGAPNQIVGVRNLRGQIVPVISLAKLFGLADEEAGRIVVAELDGRRGGLAVESVLDVGELPEPSEPTESPFLSGAALIEGTLVGLLDVESILSSSQSGPAR